MPPKKTNSGASKKTEQKKKEKVIEVSFVLLKYRAIAPHLHQHRLDVLMNLHMVVTIYRIRLLA